MEANKTKDVQGKAMLDYFLGKEKLKLKLHTSYGETERMPVDVFFREKEDFTKLEKLALKNCRGEVLDVGAGAGSFCMALQEEGQRVYALEISSLCCKVMWQRGVDKIYEGDIWAFGESKFDTLLLMMNGLGLAGSLEQLPLFLTKLKELLLPGGQIICDSSDISYMYEQGQKPADRYYGEIDYCYEYEGEKGDWFSWLYVDADTLARHCTALGLKLEIIYKNRFDQYLARISEPV